MSLRWTEEQLESWNKSGPGSPTRVRAAPAPAVKLPPVLPTVEQVRRGAHGMNRWEAEYAGVLEGLQRSGEIQWYGFERMKLRLADNTFYTPDFEVKLASGALEYHEVKGFWRDDARVKIKVAAEMYPFRFIAVTKAKKRDGGGWNFETFGRW